MTDMKRLLSLDNFTPTSKDPLNRSRNTIYVIIIAVTCSFTLCSYGIELVGRISGTNFWTNDPYTILLLLPLLLLYASNRYQNSSILRFSKHIFILNFILVSVLSWFEYEDFILTGMLFVIIVFLAANIIGSAVTWWYGLLIGTVIIVVGPRLGFGIIDFFIINSAIILATSTAFILSHMIENTIYLNIQQAETINKLYSQTKKLTGDVAHKLKTPLSVLQFELEQAGNKGTIDVRDIQTFIDDISVAIESLVSTTRLEVETIEVPLSKTNLLPLFDDIERDGQLVARYHNNSSGSSAQLDFLRVGIPDSKRSVTALVSANQLREAILNLIDNSFKHNPNHPELAVTVELRKLNGKILISVADNGKGIKASVLTKIRKGITTNLQHPTSGIGLIITSTLVQNFGGEFTIESLNNDGTKATITIPLS